MSKPRLLDLYSGAGGCSEGYVRAGFEVTGVDIMPQKSYPYRFVQADALEYVRDHGHEFDAIAASPPCQAFSVLKHMRHSKEHPNLVPQTRAALIQSGKPYVIENVPGAPLRADILLCGTMFGLKAPCGAELRRHRIFETNWLVMCGLKCRHYAADKNGVIGVYGDHARRGDEFTENCKRSKYISVVGNSPEGKRTISDHGTHARSGNDKGERRTITVTGHTAQTNVVKNVVRTTFSVNDAKIAMGIDWMTMKGLSQAIPPAYCEFIGQQLIDLMK